MKNTSILFILITLPLFVFGQFEWVKKNAYQDHLDQFERTLTGDLVLVHNSYPLEYVTALNGTGNEIFTYNTYDPNFSLHLGDMVIMPDTTVFFLMQYGSQWTVDMAKLQFDKNWKSIGMGGFQGIADNNEVRALSKDTILLFDSGQKYIDAFDIGMGFYIDAFILQNNLNDILTLPPDTIIIATENGVEIWNDSFEMIANYPEYIFDRIKLNSQSQLVGQKADTLFLLSPNLELIEKIGLPDIVKDYSIYSNQIAVLTSSDFVFLFQDTFDLINEFQITEESEFKFINFNDTSLVLAGNERYGLPYNYKGSTSPFVKEYFYDGTTTDFGQDAGVINTEYELVPSGTSDGTYKIHVKNLKATVQNFGTQSIHNISLRTTFPSFDLNSWSPKQERRINFNNLEIHPGETKVLSWDNLNAYFKNDPAGMSLDICIWTAHPNDKLDQQSSNDVLCMSEVVNDEEVFKDNFFRVFPNPASDHIFLQFSNNISLNNVTIRITNTIGEVVDEIAELKTNLIECPIDHLPNGIYFIECSVDNKLISVKRIVVSR